MRPKGLFFSPCPLFPPLKYTIVNNVQNGDGPIFSPRSSDDNKKNAFKNGDNSGHELNSLHVNRPLPRAIGNV